MKDIYVTGELSYLNLNEVPKLCEMTKFGILLLLATTTANCEL